MLIKELEIIDAFKCDHVHLKFITKQRTQPHSAYIVHARHKCEVISMALQLICSMKYAEIKSLHEFKGLLSNGIIKIILLLPRNNENGMLFEQVEQQEDEMSDPDVPTTSRDMLERQRKRRLQKKSTAKKIQKEFLKIKACRNFRKDPLVIEYSLADGKKESCSIFEFHKKFFMPTEIILPRLADLRYGQLCNENWLELLSSNFIYQDKDEKNLIQNFCHLFTCQDVMFQKRKDLLSQMTTSILYGQFYMRNANISYLLQTFHEIRAIYEHITCSEYTVHFQIPSDGVGSSFQDIFVKKRGSITTKDLELLKTYVQFIGPTVNGGGALKTIWSEAAMYLQELLIIAIQLAFGYQCRQQIIYVHAIEHLKNHQHSEFVKAALRRHKYGNADDWFHRDYFQKIINVCKSLGTICVLEFSGGLPLYPDNAHLIQCDWKEQSNKWHIYLKNKPPATPSGYDACLDKFLQVLDTNFNIFFN